MIPTNRRDSGAVSELLRIARAHFAMLEAAADDIHRAFNCRVDRRCIDRSSPSARIIGGARA
jgi:hypothetical protein